MDGAGIGLLITRFYFGLMSEHNGDLVVEPYIGKCDDCMLVLDSEWQLG